MRKNKPLTSSCEHEFADRMKLADLEARSKGIVKP